MIRKPQFDGRCQTVLTEVVNHYIENAEPAGSRSISRIHTEKLSPATIRNVMSDLEEMGYLHQPYTSSGRVPTDQGYRYFVDQLTKPENLIREVELPPDTYYTQNHNLEEVLENACTALSETSHQAGLVMLPSFSNMLFKHIEFIKVGAHEALAVFYSELGVLQNKVIPIEKETSQEELTSISNYLNQEFSGKSIRAIRQDLLFRVKNEREHYNKLKKKAMELSSKVFSEEKNTGSLLVEGTLNLLDHPEFSIDLGKMKSLLKTLEEKTKLIDLLDLCLERDGMTILIGEENAEEEMRGCSLIAENYAMEDEKLGSIAIFGPKRMDYKKLIPIVDHTAKTVSKLLSERKKEFKAGL
ncbi:MAG: heat-inducible transcriptional repressor HrcA [Nitrospinota bacterium]|nr:heat-inducible transcriptional repressor HrcA [Nitrospinota bacterium]